MKKLIIIGALTMLAGGIIFMIGFTASGFSTKVFKEKYPYKIKEYFSEKEFEGIEIHDFNSDVEIGASEDGKIHITYYENAKVHYDVTEGKTLTLKKVSDMKWYDYIFNFNFNNTPVRLLVPEEYHGRFSIITTNGKISMAGISVAESRLETTNGAINVSNIKLAGNLNADTTNGGITIQNIEGEGHNVAVESCNGGINFEDIKAGSLDGKTTNGRIKLSRVTAGKVWADSTNGDIITNSIKVLKSAKFTTTNSSITGSIVGKMDDFSISSKTTNGKSNLPDYKESGSKSLYVTTTNGRINIDFEE